MMSVQKQLLFFVILTAKIFSASIALSQQIAPPAVSFTFNLASSARTSAGVFAKDGTLIRTLWSGKTYPSGTNTETWDRLDDEGRQVLDGDYDIKVLSNNVSYTWEGTIGNSSTYTTGEKKHRWTDRIFDMRVIGNYAYFVTGYAEGQPSQRKFNLNSPGVMEEIWTNPNDIKGSGLMSHALCNDGNNIYWGGYDTGSNTSCVWATSISTGEEVVFSAGTPFPSSHGRRYASVTDPVPYDFVLGIAASSKYLFVARPVSNNIHVLNKTTGALVKTLSYLTPKKLFVDGNENLWMIQGPNVTKHTINADGTLSKPILTLTGLSDALSIQVSPDNSTVLVGDGGTNHVYKGFSNATGKLLWTVGKPGGYSTSPDVTYDKFMFRTGKNWKVSEGRDNFDNTFGSILPDGSMWLGDMGNQRLIHYAANRTTVVEEVMNMGFNYEVAVDRSNPSRVFCNYLEFEVDYNKPLQNDNDSWKLKRNWAWNVIGTKDDQYYRTRNIVTLSNGRTYNLIRYTNTAYEVVEYTTTGLRYTGLTFSPNNENFSLFTDGSLWSITNGGVGQTVQYKRRPLTGFDSKNNPVFGPAVVVEKTPTITTDDPVGHAMNGWNCNQYTTSNILVSFATEVGKETAGYVRGTGYHLGGLKNGKWLWRTSKATTRNYMGEFPSDGTYDIGNTVVYAGNLVTTLERNIFWGYNGEFWKQTQTNKYNHYYDNGLFVGQFGVVGTDTYDAKAYPGYAGNSLVWNMVKVGSDYYMYHADESQHGGVHRWKISNLNSIQEQVYAISTTNVSSVRGLTADYFDSSDLNNTSFKTKKVDPNVDFDWKTNAPTGTALSAPSKFSVRWEGYVQPAFTENYTFYLDTYGGVRLWVDEKMLINKWNNNKLSTYNSAISLQAGKRYAIRLEYTKANNNSGVVLSWSSASQSKQKIPNSNLFPANSPTRSGSVDLMEGLSYNSTLENGVYGWSRSPASDYYNGYSDYWQVTTNVQTLDQTNPDLFISFKPGSDNLTSTVSRDLGSLGELQEWSLTGKIIWPKDDMDHATSPDKGYIEVLDENENVIARLKRTFDPYPTARLYGNDKVLMQANKDDMGKSTTTLQPFSISAKSGKVTFQYGAFSPVATNTLSTSSKWQQPKSLRIVYYSQSRKEHVVGLADMKFFYKSGTGNGRVAANIAEELNINVEVYPNPAQEEIWVNYYAQTNENVTMQLVNSAGQSVLVKDHQAVSGKNTFRVPIRHLSNGFYQISLIQDNRRITRKVIISQ
ncbi:PA14 domain-containing protein [Spirosoma sp.]|uniref:PA14 domain-containing protein n=1 Tax=Spirosoma sp. TaxID=1899569 RepID=UPI003B3B181E